ncbi:MAG: glycosyltransferase [Nitrospira sp.]
MAWVDHFYSFPATVAICGGALLTMAVLSGRLESRRLVLGISMILYFRYMVWRGAYTLPTDTLASILVGGTIYAAEIYGLLQYGFFTFQAWSPTERTSPPVTAFPTVAIFVTVFDEPLDILKRTLVASRHQDYPEDRFTVCVLDDGGREEVRVLADSLGCRYLCRPDRPKHAKAGNLNYAFRQTDHEYVAVFDVDHVPVRSFLKATIGFFAEPKVAFVQTAHHFYNPDIFQRNLRLEQELQNEQALFFRVLQAGRDTHGSAFFAGSGAIFRRRALEAIGGFQTQTVSEDLHTSLVLHAHGYESRYLNKVLSVGLMPDSFDGYLKQRTRWAIGSIQTLLQDNPFTTRGLSLSQRIDYVGSIFYFFFGLPRVICLVAPLATLFFGLSILHANVWELCLNFFSFYLGSAIAMRPISRGTRNAFWSDVYEIAMCFAVSRAVLTTLLRPRKERPFEVTPKGQLIAQGPRRALARVWPHAIVFVLLAAGAVIGFWQWSQGRTIPGFGVSLFWACANLFLLSVAMLVANEQLQVRRAFRLPHAVTVTLRAGNQSYAATTLDMSEHGMAVKLRHPLFSEPDSITVHLTDFAGRSLELAGRIVRQEPIPDGAVVVAVQFSELSDDTLHALLVTIFGEAALWNSAPTSRVPTTTRSFRALIEGITRPWTPLLAKRRQTLRLPIQVPCMVESPIHSVQGTTRNISFTGLAAAFPSPPEGSLTGAILDVQGMKLKVVPVQVATHSDHTFVRFRIDQVEQGEQQWREFLAAHWQTS